MDAVKGSTMSLADAHTEAFETAVDCDNGQRFTVLTKDGREWIATQWAAQFVTTRIARYAYPELLRVGAGSDVRTAVRRMHRRRIHPRVA